jgi:hypothetical protein
LTKEYHVLQENYIRQESILTSLQEENKILKSNPNQSNKYGQTSISMQKELEKRNKKIKQLESEIKRLQSRDIVNELESIMKDPKFLNDKLQKPVILNAFFKSKIQEFSKEKEILMLRIKELEEREKNYLKSKEKQSSLNKAEKVKIDSQSQRSMSPSLILSESDLQEFTYILMKNFEAKEITSSILEHVLYNILFKFYLNFRK